MPEEHSADGIKRVDFLVVSAFLVSILFAGVGWFLIELYQRDVYLHEKTFRNSKSITLVKEKTINNEKRIDVIINEIQRLRDIMNTLLKRLPRSKE